MDKMVEAKNGSFFITDDFIHISVTSRSAKVPRDEIKSAVITRASLVGEGTLDIVTKNNGNFRLRFNRVQNDEMAQLKKMILEGSASDNGAGLNDEENLGSEIRPEIRKIISDYEINIFGNKKAIEIANEKIPISEKITYIAPSNIVITARNTNAPRLRAGVIAITEKSIYVFHKALWESGVDVFPTKNLELVGYRATGIGGATFELTLTNVTINFLAGYKKENAEILNASLLQLISNKDMSVPNKSDSTDELRKYKSLLDDGIITQDEFDAKKKQLLNMN